MIHGLAYWLGLTNASGPVYLFWSGFFGDVTILAAAVVFIRHHNCHTKGCWRLGHFHQGSVKCRRHHLKEKFRPVIPGKTP